MKIILLFVCLSAMQTCKEKPPEPPDTPQYKRNIFLAIEDTSVTEITLRITIPESVKQRTFIVKRDTQTILSALCSGLDTTFTDTALLPHHHYTYKAYRIKNNKPIDSSKIAYATTMDTTRHEFTFDIDTLGDGASSALYDVAIINENDVWAVGEIYLSGNDTLYDVAHWDGEQWKYTVASGFPAYAIYAFSSNDVWIGTTAPHHWSGQSWSGYNVTGIFNGYIKKMWGTSSADLYIVGTNGSIAHFNGTAWTKLESGTTHNLYDIWGATNPKNGELEILVVGNSYPTNVNRVILKITGTTVTTLSDYDVHWSLDGVWFLPDKHYYVVGDGIYEKRNLSESQWKDNGQHITTYYTGRVRGTSLNDVFVTGAYGEFLHFNGVTWRSFISQTGIYGGYGNIAISKDLLVTVGIMGNRGVVLRGIRQ